MARVADRNDEARGHATTVALASIEPEGVSMKLKSVLASVSVLAMVSCLVGCSGSASAPLGSGTRGEGNIPVGRVKEPRIQRGHLTIKDTSGTTLTVESDAEGIFWAPTAQYGIVEYTITPVDPSFQPLSFSAMVGVEQDGVFLADPIPASSTAVVQSIVIEFPGRPEFRIGQTVPIKVKVQGTNLGSSKPLIWLDGGVGTLNPGDQMVVTHMGSGAVNASMRGVQARNEFTVIPR